MIRATLALLLAAALAAADLVPPADPLAVLDARAEGGCVGDGVADDSEALQRALESCVRGQTRILFLPRGIYRVTRTLVCKPPGDKPVGSMLGPWVYGADRDGTVIRLADGAEGFGDPARPKELIRGVPRPDDAKMNADFFDRTLVNLTLDTGRNPGAIALRFYSNNTGLLRQVRLRGDGVVGLDLARDQNGPLLVQEVEIAGFAVGIRCAHGINSQTLSRVRVSARETGLLNRGQVLAVEGLEVRDAPRPVVNDGVLTLIDSRLHAPAGATGAALSAGKGVLCVQRLETPGFAVAIAARSASAAGPRVEAFASQPPLVLGTPQAWPAAALAAPAEPPWPSASAAWVCANDFGARAGDEEDDAPALQQAVDAAAERGATAVYLRGARGGDPNWYLMKRDVRLHGSVSRLMGFGFARILGGSSKDPAFPGSLAKFVVDEAPGAAPVVSIQHLKMFSPLPSLGYELRTPARTLLLRNLEGTLILHPGTRAWADNFCGTAFIEAGASATLRQYNTEKTPSSTRHNTRNRGGRLWILGLKTEAVGTKLHCEAGGTSAVLGCLNYNTQGVKDDTPFFAVVDAGLTVAGYSEVNFTNAWWKVPVHATLAGQELRQAGAQWQQWALLTAGR